MKRVILACLLLFSVTILAQSNFINYKALIKDAGGAVVASTVVTVQFTVLEGTPGASVYQETHTPTTDANGIVILNIGEGTPVTGTFSTIDWSSNNHFLNVQIDTGGGLQDMGTTPFNAVPYALHATTASTAENTFSGDYNDLTNKPTTPTYTVNTFYAELGGYVIEINTDGTHGLVAAMQDQGISDWYNANDLLSNPFNHDANGAKFKDWRLPTKRELNLMYINRVGIGGFTFSYYSSSTEASVDLAWTQFFFNGFQDYLGKNFAITVRTVRAF